MITIQIGSTSPLPLHDATESWIREQIDKRRQDGSSICVRIQVSTADVNMALASRDCPHGVGGGRLPNAREAKIFSLWAERVTDKRELTAGHLIAFLRQLEHRF
jgi:hypothetical protein